MKKIKILSALALASCVMLSGCNKKPEKATEVEVPKLTVADLPHLVVGETFDVSSYVTAQGGTGAVSITLDSSCEAYVSLDETKTKLTASHSGEAKFVVHYGDLSVECTAAIDSQEYVAYAQATKDPVNTYYITFYDNSYNLAEGSFVAPNYYVELYEGTYYGFVEYDRVYSFGLDVGESSYEVTGYSVSGMEPESLDEYCAPFPYVASMFTPKYVPEAEDYIHNTREAYECFSVSDQATVYSLTSELFGYNPQAMVSYGYYPVEVQIFPEYYEGEFEDYCAALLFQEVDEDTQQLVTELWDCAYFGFEEFFVGLGEEFPETAPTGVDASAAFNSLEEAIDGHNFSASISFTWFDGEFNPVAANPFYDPETSKGIYVNEFLNAQGEVEIIVTEDQTWAYYRVGSSYYCQGLVNHEGNVYWYQGDDYTNLPAEAIAFETSIFEDEEISADPSTLLFMKGLSSVFVNSYDENRGSYEFCFAEALQVLGELFIGAVPEVVPWNEEPESMADIFAMSYDFGNMMNMLVEEPYFAQLSVSFAYYEEDGEFSIFIMIPDAVVDEQTEEETPYYYIISVTIEDVGSTSEPYGVNIVYPEAE